MFRDQREVDLWYGRCPDCGDVCGPHCRCHIPDIEPPLPTPEQIAAYEKMKEEGFYGDDTPF